MTPSNSKQRRCSAVGSLCIVNVALLSAIRTVFAVSVPNSLIRLGTGRSSAVRLLAAFCCAAGDRCAGCTTDDRCCCAAWGSWKIENEGFNTLKNHGYHLKHNFGHGQQHLSEAFFTPQPSPTRNPLVCAGWLVLSNCPRHHLAVSAPPGPSLQAIHCRSPRIAGSGGSGVDKVDNAPTGLAS